MDITLLKLISSMKSSDPACNANAKDPRAVGLLVRLNMISGTPQQVTWPKLKLKGMTLSIFHILYKSFLITYYLIKILEEQPATLRGKVTSARKMGFPEVIYPNDVRNDLYINMYSGEFHRSSAKGSDKNVEVTVSVHNDRGVVLRDVISSGNGAMKKDFYKSVVYYHQDKPKWNEYFKISLPMKIEDFSTAHIRFTFKHR